MDLILLPMAAGKTWALCDRVKSDPHGILVVPDSYAATTVRRHHEVQIGKILTWDQLVEGRLQGCDASKMSVYIDDLDTILRQITKGALKGFTMQKGNIRIIP